MPFCRRAERTSKRNNQGPDWFRVGAQSPPHRPPLSKPRDPHPRSMTCQLSVNVIRIHRPGRTISRNRCRSSRHCIEVRLQHSHTQVNGDGAYKLVKSMHTSASVCSATRAILRVFTQWLCVLQRQPFSNMNEIEEFSFLQGDAFITFYPLLKLSFWVCCLKSSRHDSRLGAHFQTSRCNPSACDRY